VTRVLITGATGFIGGRLAEILVDRDGVEVVALVRGYGSAMRLARRPVRFARGEVTDLEAVRAAARGCDAIYHCAYGTSGGQRHRAEVNREGTRQVLAAARAEGVRRVVHLSTLMVYGRTGDGDLEETAPRRRFGNAYSDSKLEAERLALAAGARPGLEVAVLQPTAVYGPWGGVWTAGVLATLRRGRQILVDGGAGLANAVYVDDLVDAMILAASHPAAAGECFLVSDGAPLTWQRFFAAFEGLLGKAPGEATVPMSRQEALEHWRASRRARTRLRGEAWRALTGDRDLRERLMATRELTWARNVASALLPEGRQRRIKQALSGSPRASGPRPSAAGGFEAEVVPLSPEMIDFYGPKTAVRIDKARRLLGWEPRFDLAAGMERTGQWARWANLT
jgi:nucleoside-diphosphate-sugar epimerase